MPNYKLSRTYSYKKEINLSYFGEFLKIAAAVNALRIDFRRRWYKCGWFLMQSIEQSRRGLVGSVLAY